MFTIENIICFLYLLMLSILDIWKRKLPLWLLAAGCAGAAAIRMVEPDISAISVFLGAAAGVLFLLLSKMTREQIGYADSILILGLGIFVGLLRILNLLCIAFFLSALLAAAFLALRKFNKNTRYPFVPFLFAAYTTMIYLENL